MKTDAQIKEAVLDELAWQPNIDETEIGVAVENGIVKLNGVVNNYAKKLAAEKAAKSVEGVKAVTEDMEVRYGEDFKKRDNEITKAVVDVLEWNPSLSEAGLTFKVKDGRVYLSGEVEWGYQKNTAKRAIENLLGVRSVINNINVKQVVKPYKVKQRIKNAFERSAELDAKKINVLTDCYTVTLRGKVHSIKEKEDAERAAYRAQAVYHVKNKLKVRNYTKYA